MSADTTTDKCAACGKEGDSDNMNTCNKCKEVKYCNAACKKKHRKRHKKACERRVAELVEEALFKEVEPEECPICMLPLPLDGESFAAQFQSCCGKSICHGCIYAMEMSEGKDLCAFCRTPPPSSAEEQIKRLKIQMDKGNGEAFNTLGLMYESEDYSLALAQDTTKANELFLKAGELGCADGYYNLGISYHRGKGVEVDMGKAKYYYELAAMGGHATARNNLGCEEGEAGNHRRAMKHLILAAKAGDKTALDNVKMMFTYGAFSKDEFANTLRAYQKIQDEMKSDARDKARVRDKAKGELLSIV
jgi:hypothetical protein